VHNNDIKRQLQLFFENFYFLPRDRKKFAHYWKIDKYDCIWVEGEVEE
jgi:hypothetical protein